MIPKLRIDPNHAYGGVVSDYFQNVEYIPLETTKESLFGEINQMVITENSIVVHDIDTKSILFFNIDGKYIRKLELKSTNYILLSDNGDGNIIVSMSKNTKRGSVLVENIYSSIGRKISERKSDGFEDGLVKIEDGYFLSCGSCRFNNSEKPKDSVYNLIDIYKGNTLYKSFLPYNQMLYAGFCRLGGTVYANPRGTKITNNSMNISTPYEHMVYKVTKDTAVKILQFVFPNERSVSGKIFTSNNLKLIDSIERQIDRNSSKIIQDVRNIVYYQNKILFKITPRSYIRASGSIATQQYNFIYDTLSTKVISIERLTPDSNNYFLPIIGNGSMVVFDGLYFYNGAYYTPISSLEMFATYQANKNKNPKYTSILKNYFASQNRKSNPVIVRMKLK